MPEPVLTVTNLTSSHALIYRAPEGTPNPPDNLAVGQAWPAPWEFVGYTSAPVKIAYKFDNVEAEVEGALGAVRRKKVKESAMLETVLAELSADSLARANGGTTTTTAPGTGQPGKKVYEVGGTAVLPSYRFGVEGVGEESNGGGDPLPVRAYLQRGTVIEGAELEFSEKSYTGVPLKVAGLADLTRVRGKRWFELHHFTATASDA